GQILTVLDLKVVDAVEMSPEHVAIFESARPSAAEIAADSGNDAP
ncbi:MAG: prevent-host-death family protein, partial [Sphingobium sp. 32-64-5]